MGKKMRVIVALFIALLLGVIACQSAMAQTATEDEVATEEGVDTKDVMKEARELFRDGDFEAGIEVLEKGIEKDPKNYGLLTTAAGFYNQYGIDMARDDRKAANKPLRRAAELMRMVQAGKEDLSDDEQSFLATTVYNEACCAAIDEQTDEAFKFLDESIELGFVDVAQIENDSDFESIREDERFDKILEELESMEDDEKADNRPSDDA